MRFHKIFYKLKKRKLNQNKNYQTVNSHQIEYRKIATYEPRVINCVKQIKQCFKAKLKKNQIINKANLTTYLQPELRSIK